MGFTWALWHTVGLIMAFLLWSRSRKSRLKRWCYLLALLLKNRFCVLPDLFFFIIYPGWLHFVFLQNDGALRWFSWGSMYSSRCIIKPNPNRWKENGKAKGSERRILGRVERFGYLCVVPFAVCSMQCVTDSICSLRDSPTVLSNYWIYLSLLRCLWSTARFLLNALVLSSAAIGNRFNDGL